VTESADFGRWLREILPESFEDGAFIDDAWLRWLRGVFHRAGHLSRSAVTEQARATLEALLPSWKRIADDVQATTGRELVLRQQSDADRLGYASLDVEVVLDGVLIGWFNHDYSPDAEVFVSELAEQLREFALDEEIGGGWPICPEHRTHPLKAGVFNETAAWLCPTGRTIAAIGSLGERA
jgi:hypothetical protein